jgi:hypothetical protein
MVVAYVDKNTNRSADWPADVMALFFEERTQMPAGNPGIVAAGLRTSG